MQQQDTLGRALLAGKGVGVLVRLKGHQVLLGLGKGLAIRTQQFPIKARVLYLDPASQKLGQGLGHLAAARELSHFKHVPFQHLLHHIPSAIYEVHVLFVHPAFQHQSQKLFQNHAHFLIRFYAHFVTTYQRAYHL